MLIDVRTPEEYAAGHLNAAVNIPLDDIMAGRLGALIDVGKETSVRVYCFSGARAAYAAMFLQSAGFTDVENLGGIEDAAAHSTS
jgi:phage shock protein E